MIDRTGLITSDNSQVHPVGKDSSVKRDYYGSTTVTKQKVRIDTYCLKKFRNIFRLLYYSTQEREKNTSNVFRRSVRKLVLTVFQNMVEELYCNIEFKYKMLSYICSKPVTWVPIPRQTVLLQ